MVVELRQPESEKTSESEGGIQPENAITLEARTVRLANTCTTQKEIEKAVAEQTGGIYIAKFGTIKLAQEYVAQQMLWGAVETTRKGGEIRYAVRNLSAASPLNTPKETAKGTEAILAFFKNRKEATNYVKKLQKAVANGAKQETKESGEDEKKGDDADPPGDDSAGKKS